MILALVAAKKGRFFKECQCHLAILFFLIITFYGCAGSNRNNVIRDFEGFTGLKKGYILETKKFESNQSIVFAGISKDQKDSLMTRFRFMPFDSFEVKFHNSGKSHVQFRLYDFSEKKNDYLYYYRDDYDFYGYFIICLAKDENRLIFCESFPETSPGL